MWVTREERQILRTLTSKTLRVFGIRGETYYHKITNLIKVLVKGKGHLVFEAFFKLPDFEKKYEILKEKGLVLQIGNKVIPSIKGLIVAHPFFSEDLKDVIMSEVLKAVQNAIFDRFLVMNGTSKLNKIECFVLLYLLANGCISRKCYFAMPDIEYEREQIDKIVTKVWFDRHNLKFIPIYEIFRSQTGKLTQKTNGIFRKLGKMRFYLDLMNDNGEIYLEKLQFLVDLINKTVDFKTEFFVIYVLSWRTEHSSWAFRWENAEPVSSRYSINAVSVLSHLKLLGIDIKTK
ncbi:MAG: hypothetical protein ACTSXX_13395 [Candidatus Baldrarchaeia archaeon]